MRMRLVLLLVVYLLCVVGDCYGCPVAVIAFDPNSVACSGTSVDCNGAGSYDNDSSGDGVVSWEWDFDGDGLYDDASGETVSFPYTDVGTYTVRLKVTDGEDETDTSSKTLYIVEPNSLTATKNATCVDCNVTFTLTVDGGAVPDNVYWSASGGDPSSKDGGSTFTTHWSTTGSKTVTVTMCSTNLSKNITVADVTYYHETMWLDLGNGQLYFEYAWNSTSGNLNHLSGCKVGEKVTYPGGNPYVPDNPPFASWALDNPTIINVDATLGSASDTHSTGGGFSTPYCSKSFTGTQYYRCVRCDDSTTNLMGPISIPSSVYQAVPGDPNSWKYKVQKSGRTSIKSLP